MPGGGCHGRPRAAVPRLGIGSHGQQPGPHILAALGVVGGQGGHPQRVVRHLVVCPGQQGLCARRCSRVGADLVARHQAVPPIERGVLDALGHHRAGDLLEPDGQVPGRHRVVGCLRGEQHLPQRLHGRGVGIRAAGCAGHRRLQPLDGGRGALATGPHVGAIDVHRDEQGPQGRLQVGGLTSWQDQGGGAQQPPGLRGKQRVDDQLLGVRDDGRKPGLAADLFPGRRHGLGGAGGDQRLLQRRVCLIAGGAGALPVLRQPLGALQDLLHPDRGAGPTLPGEPAQILLGVGQPVGMVHPEPVDDAPVVQVQQQPVGLFEDVGLLHPDRDQRVHLEEAAVVQGGVGLAPGGEHVVLPPEHLGHLGGGSVEAHRRLRCGAGVLHLGHREDVVVVADDWLPGCWALLWSADVQHQLPGSQHLRQRGTKDRQPEAATQLIPVDVEPVRGCRLAAAAQHLPDGRAGPLRSGQRHVVGHDVHDHPQASAVAVGGQRLQRLPTAEFGIDLLVVDDVIAVGTAGHRGEHRGQVHVGDAEVGQVGHHLTGVLQGESGVQLQPVGGGDVRQAHAPESVSRGRGPGPALPGCRLSCWRSPSRPPRCRPR